MKKLFTFALLCSLIIAVLSLQIGAANTEMPDTGLLEAIGICDETILNKTQITRGEFAGMATRFMNVDAVKRDKPPFKDVSADDPNSGAIALLKELGYIKGVGDGLFKPTEAITAEQAANILVSVLTDNIYKKLGVPIAVSANEFGLMKKVPASQFDGAACAILLNNALSAPVFTVESLGENVTYSKDKNNTALYEFFKIYTEEGILTAADNSSLTGTESNGKNRAIINNTVYTHSCENLRELLGYNVKAYITEKEEIVYCAVWKCETVTVKAYDLDKNKSTLKSIAVLDEKGNEKEFKLDDEVDVVYNGNGYYAYTLNDILPEYGELTLIDNDYDGKYDVLKADNFITCAVNISNPTKNKLVDFYNRYIPDMENIDNLIVVKNDKIISFSDIFQGDVVGIGIDKQGKNAKLVVSSDIVRGNVEMISEEEVVIDGKEYLLAESYISVAGKAAALKVGQEVEATLDSQGRIAYVSAAANSNLRYGWVINIHSENDISVSRTEFKILTDTGAIDTYGVADKFKINDETVNVEQLRAAFSADGEMNEQLVKYRLNADGKITKMYLAGSDMLSMDFPYNSRSENGGRRVFANDGDFVYSQDTVVFAVPSGELEYDESYYKKLTDVGADYTNSQIAAFDIDEFGIARAVVKRSVVKTSNAFTSDDIRNNPVFVVDKIVKAINNNGEEIYKLYGYVRAGYTYYYVKQANKELLSSVKPGDSLLLVTDSLTDYVLNVRILHSFGQSEMSHVKESIGTYNIPWFELIYGKVYSRYGDILKISVKENPSSATDYNLFPSGSATVYVVDKNQKVSYGSLNDILPGSKILLRARGSTVNEIVVYE